MVSANGIIVTKNADDHSNLFGMFVNTDQLKEDEPIPSFGAFTFTTEDYDEIPKMLQKFWCVYVGDASLEDVGLKPKPTDNYPSEDQRPWETGQGGDPEMTDFNFKDDNWMTCQFCHKDDPTPEGYYMPEALETDEPEPEPQPEAQA